MESPPCAFSELRPKKWTTARVGWQTTAHQMARHFTCSRRQSPGLIGQLWDHFSLIGAGHNCKWFAKWTSCLWDGAWYGSKMALQLVSTEAISVEDKYKLSPLTFFEISIFVKTTDCLVGYWLIMFVGNKVWQIQFLTATFTFKTFKCQMTFTIT